MAIATYRGERSVAEIADKLFVRLTDNQRAKAEAELLKANPQLKNIAKVREGVILHVPDIPELTVKTTRDLENPGAQIAKDITGTLDDYAKQLAERTKTEQQTSKAQTTLLKSAKFKRLLADSPNRQALAGQAAKALGARAKDLAERQKTADKAIKQAIADLNKTFG